MSTIGTVELIAKIDTSAYKFGAKEIDRANKDLETSADKSSTSMNASFSKVAKVGIATLVTALVSVGAILVKNFDNAIARVDTLNNSSRTFANMGFGAQEVKKATDDLVKSILGLPTPLDSAIREVIKLSASTNNLGKSQKVFTALNDAILGFGGTTDMVSNAVTQLSQDLGTGRITAQTWLSLTNSGLTPALASMAREMGITSKALKEGLSDGTIPVENFIDSLIKLDEQGGGGMKSFQKIAQDSTKGISTGWANMQTAITRGLASIIQAIGAGNISNAITEIGIASERGLKSLVSFGQFLGELWNRAQPFVMGVINAFLPSIKALWETFETRLLPALDRAKPLFIALGAVLLVLSGILMGGFIAVVWLSINVINILMNVLGFLIQVGANVVAFFRDTWSLVYGYIKDPFINAFNVIRSVFSGLYGFFAGIWSSIVGLFGSVGSAVGNAIGSAFSSVINAIISRAVGIINGFIHSINSVVGVIQKIPGVGGKVGKMSEISVPRLATGGIVSSPTLAMIGEGREAEAVIPLSKLDAMLTGSSTSNNSTKIEINVSGTFATSPAEQRKVAQQIADRLEEVRRSKGLKERLI